MRTLGALSGQVEGLSPLGLRAGAPARKVCGPGFAGRGTTRMGSELRLARAGRASQRASPGLADFKLAAAGGGEVPSGSAC
jgi:hypothetical protein